MEAVLHLRGLELNSRGSLQSLSAASMRPLCRLMTALHPPEPGGFLDGEFDSPPSPPETRGVILRTGKLVRGIFFVEDYTTSFPGGGYLEQGLKGGLRLQSHDGSLFHGVNIHRFQHGREQLPPF